MTLRTRQRLAWLLTETVYIAAAALLVLLIMTLLGGCANFSSRQVETAADGTQRQTQIHVWTLFDAHSDVTKLRASTTDKTQGMSLAGLDQSASSTNLVRILELVAALAAATAK